MSSPRFEVIAPFSPAGDQPRAIAELTDGLHRGDRFQTLLGVTGSGKTMTVAQRHRELRQADARPVAQQDAGRAALRRASSQFFPAQRGRVLHLVLRLLPARSVRPVDRHVHREGRVDQRGHRPSLRLRATSSLMEREDVVIVATVSAIYGLGDPVEYREHMVTLAAGRASRATTSCARWSASSTAATTSRSSAAPSACAATRSRSSRPTRSRACASRCGATRSSASPRSIRSPARRSPSSSARDLSGQALRHRAADDRARGHGHPAELAERLAELRRAPGSCSRRSGSSRAPTSTSR